MEPQTTETLPPASPDAPLRSSWLGWLLGILRHEPAHALTLFYIGTSALGLWASYWFFRSFGIPVMDYMDPSDYITAGLRDPMYFLMIIAVLVFTLVLNFHEFARRKGAEYYERTRAAHWWGRVLLPFPYQPRKSSWRRWFSWNDRVGFSLATGIAFSVVWATLWLTTAYVQDKAEGIRKGGGHIVRITLAHTLDPQPGTARLLGTIGDFVFLYWPEQKRAEAIAVEEVGRIESLISTSDSMGKTVAPAASNPAH